MFHWSERIYLHVHRIIYNRRRKKQHHFRNKYIISVGNLSVGGVGKTPLTSLLANTPHLREKTLLILRGYKARLSKQGLLLPSLHSKLSSKTLSLHSQKKNLNQLWCKIYFFLEKYFPNTIQNKRSILSNASMSPKINSKEVGDESLLLAYQTRAKVAISKNRKRAIEKYGKNCKFIILDDAFQNPSIYHNHEIVLLDTTRPPYGNKNSRLLPLGRMREPLEALRRAHTILLTRCELCNEKEIEALQKLVQKFTSPKTIYLAFTLFKNLYKIDLENYLKKKKVHLSSFVQSPSSLPPKKIYTKTNQVAIQKKYLAGAFCGLANPKQFFETIEKYNLALTHKIIFPDHHYFTIKDIRKLASLGCKHWITTAKDIMRLLHREPEFYEILKEWDLNFYEWASIMKIKKTNPKQEDFFKRVFK